MTDSCEHGYLDGRGCHECDSPMMAMRGVWWALLALAILAGAFAVAWWWAT